MPVTICHRTSAPADFQRFGAPVGELSDGRLSHFRAPEVSLELQRNSNGIAPKVQNADFLEMLSSLRKSADPLTNYE
jgi:hypothetical protein